MSIESFLYGVAAASAFMWVYGKAHDIMGYRQFRKWCDQQGIPEDEITRENIARHYGMWRLSQLDGVEIVRHKETNDGERNKE